MLDKVCGLNLNNSIVIHRKASLSQVIHNLQPVQTTVTNIVLKIVSY